MDDSDSEARPAAAQLRATFDAGGYRGGSSAFRRRVRDYLVERGVDPARVPDAVLVLSELLTNALEASPVDGLVDIEVTAGPRAVRLDVTNRLTTAPPAVWPALAGVEMPPATAERGRGLPLVAALAARMAIDVSDDRTHVRADLIV